MMELLFVGMEASYYRGSKVLQMMNTKLEDIEELKALLQVLGPENIWRPIYTPDNIILSDGIGDELDGLTEDLDGLDFKNKSVVDLGCNLGSYCFLALRAGASNVLGIDVDKRIIHGCNILKKIYGTENISFMTQDITTLNGDLSFDIGMMIDFLGKNAISTGLMLNFLDALELVSHREMIISVRPEYRIKKHLQNDIEGIIDKYSQRYVRRGRFYALEYVTDRFKGKWNIEIVSPKNDPEGSIKETVYFRRMQSPQLDN